MKTAAKTFHVTITVNFEDGSEQDDVELEGTYTAEDIGEAAWSTAAAFARSCGAKVTSLVIVAVVA